MYLETFASVREIRKSTSVIYSIYGIPHLEYLIHVRFHQKDRN